ncbi:MAG: ABC transporter permease [Vicinamibacterales bacterium]
MIGDVLLDVRHALRGFRRHPGFAAAAVTMLAVGIGANTAVFTLANGILFRGAPHLDPSNRIVYIQTPQGVSYPDFEDWRSESRSFDGGIGIVFSGGNRTLLDDQRGPREVYDATQLGANAFQVLGQRPIIGRDFTPSDELPGAPPVLILSHHLWERRYGKDPGIIGQTVRINSTPASWGAVDLVTGTTATIIGVMPPEFRFPMYRVDLWLPLVRTSGALFPDVANRQTRNFWFAFARLADGVTLEQARAEMQEIGRRLERAYPVANRGIVPSVKSFREAWLGPNAATFYASMWAAVAFVLLIACANLANLLVARAIGRSREIAARVALGASRWRVMRQLLIESLLLSAAGGLAGGALAAWGVRTYNLVANDPYSYARWDYGMDYRVLAYLVGISIVTGLLFGMAPAARVSRLDINSALKDGGRGAAGQRTDKRFFNVLVIAEIALALVVLAGAGVMIRSVLAIATSDLGITTANVLTGLVGLPSGRYPDPQAQVLAVRQITSRLVTMPGVESVAIATALPAGAVFRGSRRSYELDGHAQPTDGDRRPPVTMVAITSDYFRTLGATVRQGRAFTDADGPSAAPVAVVNQRFASLSWPGEDAVGKTVRLIDRTKPGGWLTIVGVVSNIVQDDRAGQQSDPVVYRPFEQEPATVMWVLARTRVPPESAAAIFRQAVESIDPDLLAGPGPYGVVSSLDALLTNNYRSHSVNGALFLIFAVIAVLLASIGLYAIVAHSVSQRIPEIGIRVAMGASAHDILALIMTQGMWPVGIGLLVGLPAALAVMPVLKSQLVSVSAADPVSLGAAAGILVVAAALGCFVPARRAVRIDPVVALRHE